MTTINLRNDRQVVDYLVRDYDSFRQALLDLISSKLPEWTDRSEADFGLALRLHSQDPRLTEPGTTPGTPYYMAPEQFQQEFGPLGPHTDVWALGVILYELLTGDMPFHSDNAWALAHEVVTQSPLPPSVRVAGLAEKEHGCRRVLGHHLRARQRGPHPG